MQVNLAQFLEPFFPDYTESLCVRALKPHGAPDEPEYSATKLEFTREQLENDEQIETLLQELNNTRGLYFVVNAGGHKDNEITRFNAWFAEIDDRPMQEQHRLFDHGPLIPSIRIETRKSVHAYWLIKDGCDEADWRNIQLRLIAYYQGDNKIKNPSRVMRLPLYDHIAFSAGTLERQRVRLVEFEPARTYTLAEMRRAFPASIEVPQNGHGTAIKAAVQTGQFTSWDQLATELRSRVMRHPSARMQTDGWWHCKGICHGGKGDTAVMFNPASGAVKCMNDCDYRDVLVAFGLPDRPIEPTIIFGRPDEQTKDETIENILKLVYSWGDLKNRAFAEGEKIVATLERGECGMVISLPDAGKTTLTLNLALSLITGQAFPPFTPVNSPPRRVLLIDGETSMARWQRDVRRMTSGYDESALSLIDENLHVVAEAEIAGEPLTLTDHKHLVLVAEQALAVEPDLIVVDTLASLFVLFDENANAEVAKKVWRPLQRLARVTRAAVLLLHHVGKGTEDSNEVSMYKGRGASSSGGAARLIVQLKPDMHDRSVITVHCAKAKGDYFDDVKLKLDKEARWFQPTGEQAKHGDVNRELVLQAITHPMRAVDIFKQVEGMMARNTVWRIARELYDDNLIQFADGFYSPIEANGNNAEVDF